MFSARCTQCPRVTAVRVCTAITRVWGRVVRAPGSGTEGPSARAGLVLLQSSAFRNAYITQSLGEGGEFRRSDRIPAFLRSLPGFWKEAKTLAVYFYDGEGGDSSFVCWVRFVSGFRSLLQTTILAGSGAQPPRFHFSQFSCNHLISVSPPPPLPPPSERHMVSTWRQTSFL